MSEVDNERPRYLLAVGKNGFFTQDTHNDDKAVRDAAGNVIWMTGCDWQDAANWVAEQNGYHERHMQNLLTDVFRSAF